MLVRIQSLFLALTLRVFYINTLPLNNNLNTWQIERYREADVLKTVPERYVCKDVVGSFEEEEDGGGLCKCSRETPSFMLFSNGTFGCYQSKDICQGK